MAKLLTRESPPSWVLGPPPEVLVLRGRRNPDSDIHPDEYGNGLAKTVDSQAFGRHHRRVTADDPARVDGDLDVRGALARRIREAGQVVPDGNARDLRKRHP